MEIGADHGKSLQVWASYFDRDPELIVGLAYGRTYSVIPANEMTFENDMDGRNSTVIVLEGDQASAETMAKLAEFGPWDVLIDDGSHVPQHVLYSLFSLWPSIKAGGMYIIEDIETSYWKANSIIYGYEMPHTGFQSDAKHSVVYKLKELLDVLVRNQLGLNSSSLSIMPGDGDLCSMEWGMNIIALKKCGPEDGVGPPVQPTKPVDPQDLTSWLEKVYATNPALSGNGLSDGPIDLIQLQKQKKSKNLEKHSKKRENKKAEKKHSTNTEIER